MSYRNLSAAVVLLLSGCEVDTPEQASVYVIHSEDFGHEGTYLKAEATGKPFEDFDESIFEPVLTCFDDVRARHWEGTTDGGGQLQVWIPAQQFRDPLRQKCLKGSLPAHARIKGPLRVTELEQSRGAF